MRKEIPGIHHVTAVASDPQRNLGFCTGILGLRLVKLTVTLMSQAPITFISAMKPDSRARCSRFSHGLERAGEMDR
jgi:catechol 2,3-dioxygenase-like lactoylglutathione lyase family enzyme